MNMRAQGIFLNYIEEWARLLFLLQILGFSLSFFTKIALFMFYYKYRYGLILSNCFVFEVICVKMRIMRAKKYDIFS
ncbi:hypothetical protein DXB87_17210 [Phocaeicola plebeius]|uniref:Uncharacterized protein n=1 Tax=Phocaeicola plebeius TaxID=310297 RepID=A0A3E4Z3I6_9BACT|nr:hypothetical protein DXB87_17210 [Phocaeicola plebeius]HAI01726.1 hypothetical protein [Bacteroides sp.]